MSLSIDNVQSRLSNIPIKHIGADSVEYHYIADIHRTTGPAIVYPNGDYKYVVNGVLHREDGPAVKSGKNTYWFKNGIYHRVGGPAIIMENNLEWYYDGVKVEPNSPYRLDSESTR